MENKIVETSEKGKETGLKIEEEGLKTEAYEK